MNDFENDFEGFLLEEHQEKRFLIDFFAKQIPKKK